MNVILERKAPYIKPITRWAIQQSQIAYIIISNDTPDYQRLYPFYCLILFIMGETFRWWYYSAYMEEKTQLNIRATLTISKYRTIYYY